MLTAELLQYTRRQDRVYPRLLAPDDAAPLAAAEQLGALFSAAADGVGARRGELDEGLRAAAFPGVRPATVRALAKLLLERCEFEAPEGVQPHVLRQGLFEAAARRWQAQGSAGWQVWRSQELARQGSAHGLEGPQVETALFSDLAENQRLVAFRPIPPRALLLRHNVAQVQGLLLGASRLQIEAPQPGAQRMRQMFRYLKFFGLLFEQAEAASSGGGPRLRLTLDGPLSVLESATRYGMQLAQFLPALLLWDTPWTLEAELRLRRHSGPLRLLLEPHPHLQSHYPDHGQWVPEDVQRFVALFNRGADPWQAEAAVELLTLPGNRYLVPDFAFTHLSSGRKAYLEVLAYPQPERVVARLNLAAQAAPATYLIACRGVPAVKAAAGAHPNLVTYRRSLIAAPVREALAALAP